MERGAGNLKIIFGHEILSLVNEQLKAEGLRPIHKQRMAPLLSKLREAGYVGKGTHEYACVLEVAQNIALYAVTRQRLIAEGVWGKTRSWSVEDYEDVVLDNIG
jgi:hypothetical protein